MIGSTAFAWAGGVTTLQRRGCVVICELESSDACDSFARKRMQGEDTRAFFLVDLGVILRRIDEWRRELPNVHPHYAVKACDDDIVCDLMRMSGVSVDCSSLDEIKRCLRAGFDAGQILYANPVKELQFLQYAREHNIKRVVFDSQDELAKIQRWHEDAELVLRIHVDDTGSVCRLGTKFGAHAHELPAIFTSVNSLGLDLMGISFHVGSGARSTAVFDAAIAAAKRACNLAAHYNIRITLLDIGGGFDATCSTVTFADVAATVRDALARDFPPELGVQVCAEPGRFLVSESHTYYVNVIGKRVLSHMSNGFAQLAHDASAAQFWGGGHDTHDEEQQRPDVALYVNDGVYGCFNCVAFDHKVVQAEPVLQDDSRAHKHAIIYGPTCDSIDVVMPRTLLQDMKVAEWLKFRDMGAYTRVAASHFNGQGNYHVLYVCTPVGDALV